MTDHTCSIDDCERPAKARNWCTKHYQRWRAHGDPRGNGGVPPFTRQSRAGMCAVDDCEELIHARGWCTTHYQRWRKRGTTDPVPERICNVEDCERRVASLGYCEKHYLRLRRTGRLDLPWADAPAGMKWCAHCETYKQRSAFYVSRTMPSGRTSWCKRCLAAAQRTSDVPRQVKRRRRARLLGRESEPYTSTEIAERDGWICQICRGRIAKRLKAPHPQSLSIDHIVPVAKGGDDVKRNIQAAHLGCNRSKNTRGTDQLRLIG